MSAEKEKPLRTSDRQPNAVERPNDSERLAAQTGCAKSVKQEVAKESSKRSGKARNAVRKPRVILDREVLANLYLEKKLSCLKISELLATTTGKIRSNLKWHGIPIRTSPRYLSSNLTRELLEDLYVKQGKTAVEIAGMLNYRVLSVRKKLKLYGLKKRPRKNFSAAVSEPADRRDDSAAKANLFYKPREAAQKLKVSYKTVIASLKRGDFPHAVRKQAGKKITWSIPAGDVESYVPRPIGAAFHDDPSPKTIIYRGVRAQTELFKRYGYGRRQIIEMMRDERQGFSRAEIAARFRVDLDLIEKILDRTAIDPPIINKKLKFDRVYEIFPRKLLIKLYVKNNYPTAKILMELKTDFATLKYNLELNNIPLKSERLRLSAEEWESFLRLHFIEQKMPIAKIAAALGVTRNHVVKMIRRFNL